MFRLTVKNLLAKKIRFALTTLAVIASVAMVVGVFVMTDSLRSSFEGLAENIAGSSDLSVRSPQELGNDFDRRPVDEAIADVVAAVDGVGAVTPVATSFNDVVVIDGDGNAIRPSGPPALGFNWLPEQFFLINDGREPTKADEFVVDVETAARNGLIVGEAYDIDGPLRQERFTLVGLFRFGSPDRHTGLGQTMAAFELETARAFFGLEGSYSEVTLTIAPDADLDEVQAAVQQAVGPDLEVITAEAVREETASEFNSVISIFNSILLAFAFIIVFVATFIINNTFQIVVSQRIRELGLLRAIGATGRQVSRSVYLEALLVGVFSTVVGIGLGILLGNGLRELLNLLGFALPSGPTELRPRTVVWAASIGIGVTMLSSIVPARRARTIPPIAAINADQRLPAASLTRRLYLGGTMVGLGTVLLGLGLFVASSTRSVVTLVAVGAVLVFIGTNTLSPSFARPAALLIGRPLATTGISCQIARGNAARSPRRTASTAGALMIGLALVGMAAVVGASLSKTFLNTLDNSVKADYFIQSTSAGFDPSVTFSEEVPEAIRALPEFDSVVRYRWGQSSISVAGTTGDLFTADLAEVDRHLDADVVAGDLAGADPERSIAVHRDVADDLDLRVGSPLPVTFPDGETESLTVAAIFLDGTLFGNWLVDNAVWERHFTRTGISFASATVAGFSDDLSEAEQQALLSQAAEAIAPITDRFPTVIAENRVEFRQSQQDQLNSFLAVIFALLALSLVIALIGIANTLALSVFERTREIGLLRAVGMTRRQLRRAIRWESVIIAVFGALLGLTLGVLFGVAAVVAIPDSLISTASIPFAQLIGYVLVAAIAGIVAAILPAFRASRLNILDAISHD